jgi:hypothetical protein
VNQQRGRDGATVKGWIGHRRSLLWPASCLTNSIQGHHNIGIGSRQEKKTKISDFYDSFNALGSILDRRPATMRGRWSLSSRASQAGQAARTRKVGGDAVNLDRARQDGEKWRTFEHPETVKEEK